MQFIIYIGNKIHDLIILEYNLNVCVYEKTKSNNTFISILTSYRVLVLP